MKKYRIKRKVLYTGIAAFAIISIFAGLVVSQSFGSKPVNQNDNSNDKNYPVYEKDMPVVNSAAVFKKPFIDSNVKIIKGFYDSESEEAVQENSIIYYESTYMQNCSVAYGGVESFDVVSILDGKVTKIKDDDLVGTVIEIEHEKNIVSVYQSVGDVKVKEGDIVKQGDIIAKSGTSSINKDLKSHLLFELLINGKIVNPESYFEKEIASIKE